MNNPPIGIMDQLSLIIISSPFTSILLGNPATAETSIIVYKNVKCLLAG